jgi:hypothetical protein
MQIDPAYAHALAEMLRESGHDPSAVGRIPTGPLDENEFLSLCTRAVSVTGDRALGLRFGATL